MIGMEELKRRFQESLAARARTFEAICHGLRAGGSERAEAIEAARRAAHALRGSGGTFGFPRLTEVAGEVEDAPEQALPARIERLLAALREAAPAEHLAPDTIVVIDDDRHAREPLVQALSAPERRVLVAGTAREGERLIRGQGVTMVVLDLGLPDADGRALLRRVRQEPSLAHIPVVVLSAKRGTLARTECAELGIEEFVEKPYQPEVVAASILGRLRRRAEQVRQSRTDALTGLLDRAGIQETFSRLLARGEEPLSVALLDMDRFKAINDARGHAAGDAALRWVAGTISNALRTTDVVGRWGGDEFVVLFPRTELTRAVELLNTALASLQGGRAPLPDGSSLELSFSSGVVQYEPGQSLEALVAAADRPLRQVKLARRATPTSNTRPRPDPTRKKVLVVDDDPLVATLVRRRFEAEGFAVEVVEDGKVALSEARRHDLALILLDLKLPGVDGFEVLRQLRAAGPHKTTPIMMLTAQGRESDVVHGLQLGADDYVVKPFSPRELTARARRLLERQAGPPPTPGRISGAFMGDQLLELVQMLGMCGKTGVLTVQGTTSGSLALRDGRLVSAWSARGRGLETAHELLALRHGAMEFRPGLPEELTTELDAPVAAVLLEGMRRRDEALSSR